MSFRWVLEVSQLNPTAFVLFMADSIDSVLTQMLTWDDLPLIVIRKTVLRKIVNLTDDNIRNFAVAGNDSSSTHTFYLQIKDINGTDYLEESVIFPQRKSINIDVHVYNSGSDVVLDINYYEYDEYDNLLYSDSFSYTLLTSPVLPYDCQPLIDDVVKLVSKINGVF